MHFTTTLFSIQRVTDKTARKYNMIHEKKKKTETTHTHTHQYESTGFMHFKLFHSEFLIYVIFYPIDLMYLNVVLF